MAKQHGPGTDDFLRELIQRGRSTVAALWLVGALAGLVSISIPLSQWAVAPPLWLLLGMVLLGVALTLRLPIDRVRLEAFLVPLTLLAVTLVTLATGYVNGLQTQFIVGYALVAGLSGFTASATTVVFINVMAGGAPLLLLLQYRDPVLLKHLIVQIPMQTMVAYFGYRLTQYLSQDRKEKRRLAVVAKTSRILTSLDPDALLEATADHLLDVTHSSVCIISLIERPGNYPVNRIVRFLPGAHDPDEVAAVQRLKVRVGEGLTGWVAAHGEPVLSGNPLDDPRSIQIPGTTRVEESMIVVPLYVHGEVAGVIRISRPGLYQYSAEDLQLTEILANHVSAAMEKARLYQEARRLAVTDDLTGLGNARSLEARLFEEVARARRYNHPLSLVLIDSDSLKRVNDQFGHLHGNELIRVMSEAIRSNIRASDIAFRYAGDEFVVLMPETSAQEATVAAERIRAAIERRGLVVDGKMVSVTASVGVATFPDHATDAEDLVRKADLAMYAAKAGGKNRVVLSGIGA